MAQADTLFVLLHSGVVVCSASVNANGGLIGSLFLTGLLGSLSHCAGMCGPFVLSQVAARLEAVPASCMSEWRRLAGAALLPYHLGRATTYAVLGAAAALAAGALGGTARWLGAVLLAAAAAFMLALALPGLTGLGPAGGGSRWAVGIGRLASPLFRAPVGWRGWLLGMVLGYIPCGLVYAALAAAAASGDAIAGAAGMLAFAAGTVPMLVAVAAVGHAAVAHWRAPLLKWAPLLLALNAVVLGFMAWRLMLA